MMLYYPIQLQILLWNEVLGKFSKTICKFAHE